MNIPDASSQINIFASVSTLSILLSLVILYVVIDTVLLVILLFIFVVLPLIARRNKPEKSLSLSNPNYVEFEKQLQDLLTDPSPLTELSRFVYLIDIGREDAQKAPEVINMLLQGLEERWNLAEIGRYNEVELFDPQQHRVLEKKVRIGERVRIIIPGWKLGTKTIKYPIVEPTK